MELIYLWLEDYRNISNLGFNFSTDFRVDFDKSGKDHPMLSIIYEPTTPKLFDGKIDQITAIIGKNGSGKTNILDILGAKRYDRQNLGNYKNLKYFIIYHLERDLIAIEGSNFDLIKKNITGYSNGESRNHISEPYSIVVELKEEQLIYKGFITFANGKNYEDNVNFINYRWQYKGDAYRHYESLAIENEPSHLFNRVNLSNKNTGFSAIYEMIIDLSKKSISNQNGSFMFGFNNNPYLTISKNMHLEDSLNLELKKGFEEERIDLLKPYAGPQYKFSSKVDFVNKFLYNLCHYLVSYFFTSKNKDKYQLIITRLAQRINVKQDDYCEYYMRLN